MEQNPRDRQFFSENKIQEQNQDNLENYPLNESLDFSRRSRRGGSFKKILLFILFSGAVIFLVFSQIYENFSNPFKTKLPDFILAQMEEERRSQAETIEDLKKKDTDGDGLTDYEEIFIYGTSIFLEDTSGDGISDYEAVRMGIDPLCPHGQNCSLLRLITPQTKLSEIVQNVQLNPNLTLQEASLAEFRKFLIENGMDEEEVSLFSDDDLIGIFSIWLESGVISEEEWLAETTPEEIREFLLVQPGVDLEEINNLNDEELLQIREGLISQGIF